jgi:hypothetical protein
MMATHYVGDLSKHLISRQIIQKMDGLIVSGVRKYNLTYHQRRSGVNNLVRITVNDDGDDVFKPKWCIFGLVYNDAARTLCTGEVFGYGEGEAVYTTKEVVRGGITCPNCITIIKTIKSVKL